MSHQWGQNGGRPDFAPPEPRGPALPSPYSPAPFAPEPERVRPRLSMKTGAAIAAGLVAILVIGAVTVWASSPRPQSAMPAAWTAEPSASTTAAQHPTAPLATGNRATSSASATARTTSSAATKAGSATKQSATTETTTSSSLPSCGRTVSGSIFSVTLPPGWECMGETPSEPDVLVVIYNPEWDIIQVTAIGSKDAATGCGADLARQVTRLVPQPDTVWGGKAARTAKVEVGGVTGQVRCVESKGIVYLMFGAATGGTYEGVATAMSAVGSAWLWK